MGRDLRKLKLNEWRLSDIDLSLLSDEEKYHLCMDGVVDISEIDATEDSKVDAIVVLGAYPNHIDARVRKGLALGLRGYSDTFILSGGRGVHRLLYKTKQDLVDQGLIDPDVKNLNSELEKTDTKGKKYINSNYYREEKILNFVDSIDLRFKNQVLFDGDKSSDSKESKINRQFKDKVEKTIETLDALINVYENDGEAKERIENLNFKKKHLQYILDYINNPDLARQINRINHTESSLMRKLINSIPEDEKPKGMKIYEEPFSFNTAENAEFVGKVIKDIERTEHRNISKICVITSAFCMKRTLLTFKKKIPGVTTIGCPSTQDLSDRGISLKKEELMGNTYNRTQILLEPEKCQKYTRDVYDEFLINLVDEEFAKKIVENQLKNVPIDNEI